MDVNTGTISLRSLFLLAFFGMAATAPVTVQNNVDSDSMSFLESYGYLRRPDLTAGQLLSDDDITKALKRMQAYAGLPQSGILDNETKKLMNTSRCGMADVGRADIARRKRRYNIQGTKWTKQELTWRVDYKNNDGLTKSEVERTVSKSLSKWEGVTNLNFKQITSGEPDIWFKFVKGGHGDPYPFRLPYSNVLAHAFYPMTNSHPLSGDVHFNDEKHFTIESKKGTNLLWVAVHELGHSIGLDHSNVKGAIMYPYYQGYMGKDFDLTPDDILGAQALYGKKTETTPKIPETTVKPVTGKCFSKITGVLLGNDKRTYMFNNDKLYILRANVLGVEKGPIPVSTIFNNVKKVDAVFKRQSDSATIILSGKNYFVFSGDNKYLAGPLPISYGFVGFKKDFGDVDGAFVWPGNNLLYIFKGRYYWRVYINGPIYKVATGYPRKISNAWGGVPNDIDGVTKWANGVTYFFKGTKYYRLSNNLKVEPGYPKDISVWTRMRACQAPNQIVGGTDGKNSASISSVTMTTLLMAVVAVILQVA